jgi:Fic family protein
MESHHGKLQGYEGCRRIDLDVSWQKLLKEFEEAIRSRSNQADEGVTVQELSSMFKISKEKVKEYLREMIRLGKVAPKRGFRPSLDGVQRGVPVYILKKEK